MPSQNEFAIALWKSETSNPARITVEEMRRRTELLETGFRATTYIPFVIAALIAIGSAIALVLSKLSLDRVAASLGILAGVYLAVAARRVINKTVDADSKCIDAYKFQLAQQRDSLNICGVTFALLAVACALGSAPAGELDAHSLVWMTVSAAPGLISYVYVKVRGARYRRRIEELEATEHA